MLSVLLSTQRIQTSLTGKVLDLARARRLVEPLGIPLLADVDGDLHIHLEKVAGADARADPLAVLAVGRDEGDEGDDAVVREQLGNLADPADRRDRVTLKKERKKEKGVGRVRGGREWRTDQRKGRRTSVSFCRTAKRRKAMSKERK
jgi:hypothetical protein